LKEVSDRKLDLIGTLKWSETKILSTLQDNWENKKRYFTLNHGLSTTKLILWFSKSKTNSSRYLKCLLNVYIGISYIVIIWYNCFNILTVFEHLSTFYIFDFDIDKIFATYTKTFENVIQCFYYSHLKILKIHRPDFFKFCIWIT